MIAMIPFFQSCLGLLRGREVPCSRPMRDIHNATMERPMSAVYHTHGILVRAIDNVFVGRMMVVELKLHMLMGGTTLACSLALKRKQQHLCTANVSDMHHTTTKSSTAHQKSLELSLGRFTLSLAPKHVHAVKKSDYNPNPFNPK